MSSLYVQQSAPRKGCWEVETLCSVGHGNSLFCSFGVLGMHPREFFSCERNSGAISYLLQCCSCMFILSLMFIYEHMSGESCRVPEGLVDVVLSYCHHTLFDKTLEGLLPYLQGKGVGVINASVLSMGLLTPQARHMRLK